MFRRTILLTLAALTLASSAWAGEAAPPVEGLEHTREVLLSRLTLTDGQTLRGQVVEESEESVTLQLVNGGRMELARTSIREIAEEPSARVSRSGQLWFRDPNRTRYFYSPSAMMLRRGEGYFSQKELVFSSVAYGVTDHITVLAGAIVPAWFIGGGSGLNFIGGIKVGGSITENFHLAAGAETLMLPGFTGSGAGAVGFIFGGTTVGGPDMHFTVNAGKPFALSSGGGSFLGDAIVTVNGSSRLTANFSLMTENWLMPYFGASTPTVAMINSLGCRFFGDRWAVDLALMRVDSGTGYGFMPIPWVDFTYNFG